MDLLLFEQILNEILLEQDSAEQTNIYTPEQQKFLGKFAQKGSTSLGILYSKTPAGIEEFILRSGTALSLTPHVFNQLLQTGIISIQPYGTRRNHDYTVVLQIPLEDVAEFASATEAPTTDSASGADTGTTSPSTGGGMTTADLETPEPAGAGGEISGAEETPEVPAGEEGGEAPEVPEPEAEEIPAGGPEESFRKDGDLIVENAALHIYNYKSILEQSGQTLKQILSKPKTVKIHTKSSRVLNRLPAGYIYFLEKIIQHISKRVYTDLEKEHLVADLLDNLAHNLGLTPNQILRSYVYYKHQNKLRNILNK